MTIISLIVLILSVLMTIGLAIVAFKAIMFCADIAAPVILILIISNIVIYGPICGFISWNGEQTGIIIPEKVVHSDKMLYVEYTSKDEYKTLKSEKVSLYLEDDTNIIVIAKWKVNAYGKPFEYVEEIGIAER